MKLLTGCGLEFYFGLHQGCSPQGQYSDRYAYMLLIRLTYNLRHEVG